MRYPALLACVCVIILLFRMDAGKSKNLSVGLWIPLAWMFLAGSRYVSQWLQIGEPLMSAAAFDEGSPLDAFVFFLLIAAGVFVLYRRKIGWSQLLSRNKWIFLYFAYCGFSICWSDDTLVCFKRYVKELGNVVMVLVILTEEYPYEALRAVLRRLTFAIMPLSLLFVRYFPELGRAYAVEGQQMFTGVSLQKNGLGMMCLISGICFSWDLLLRRKERALWEDREGMDGGYSFPLSDSRCDTGYTQSNPGIARA
jgi:hypothetical protein